MGVTSGLRAVRRMTPEEIASNNKLKAESAAKSAPTATAPRTMGRAGQVQPPQVHTMPDGTIMKGAAHGMKHGGLVDRNYLKGR